MIKEYTASAPTLEEARELAKAQLNAPDSVDIQFEVLSAGKKKTFGLFGGAPAKVRAYYEAPDPAPEKKPRPEKKPAADVKPAEAPAKREAAKPAQPKHTAPAAKKPTADETPSVRTAPAPDEPVDDPVSRYLVKIVSLMGLPDVAITAAKDTKNIVYNIAVESGDQGVLIGRRGETLDAIQYLARLVANMNGEDYDRVAVNVGNYRQKREVSLRSLAKRSASQVLKYGRNVSLEPMNPYERRIIHTAVQEIEGVQSFSVGSDASRRVVISLEEGVEPTHPSKGGYNNNRGGRGRYNNNRGGRNGGYKKDNYAQRDASAPAREPKSDVEGVGLYSKIEVKKNEDAE